MFVAGFAFAAAIVAAIAGNAWLVLLQCTVIGINIAIVVATRHV